MGERSSRIHLLFSTPTQLLFCFLFRSGKASRSKYRNLAPSTLMRYKNALFDPITLFLRARHMASFKKQIGQVEMIKKFHLTPTAMHAAIGLYNFLVSVPLEDEIPGNQLRVHVHRVLVGLLTSSPPTEVRAGGLFDITLALRAYKGADHGFGAATIASAWCAMFQYGMRSIVVHIARLGGGKADYKKIEKPDDEGVSDGHPTAADTEESEEEMIPALDECDPTDIDEEEIDVLLESDLEQEAQLISQTGTPRSPVVNTPKNTDTGNEEIEDPFLAFESSDDRPQAPDFTQVKDDDLLK